MVYNTRTEKSKDHWETPQYFFNLLDAEYHFTLDPCASDENHKCETYFTIEDDGLSKDWEGHNVFCNPPYKQIPEWCEKSYKEGEKLRTLVVMLIPVRSDTEYWHEWVMKADRIGLVKGRIQFEINGKPQGSPNFASAVVTFTGNSFDHCPLVYPFYHKQEDILKQECDILRWAK